MEPIRVNRHTGQIISAPTYTPEQMDVLLTAIAKALVQKRPDLFRVDTPAGEEAEGNNIPRQIPRGTPGQGRRSDSHFPLPAGLGA